jgi:alkanesulfonate monooxygenase SsuD/methylene tetrahydromethanopterin reductase-like flavin-dependent oxidoreductase (luciferase family)
MDYGFGIAGALDAGIVARLAPVLEQLGFQTLWVNDTPDGDSLAGCAAALRGTSTLRVATGVIPIDRRPAADILADVRERGIDPARLTIGIGSGRAEHPLRAVREAVEQLRSGSGSGIRIAVGALGPKMTTLAATQADEVLFNWLTPAGAAESAASVRQAAAGAGVAAPRTTTYVRVAIEPGAIDRLRAEAARYESYPAYAANFRRFGVSGFDTTVGTDDIGEIGPRLGAYAGAVDEVVVRAITSAEMFEAYHDLAVATAPARS